MKTNKCEINLAESLASNVVRQSESSHFSFFSISNFCDARFVFLSIRTRFRVASFLFCEISKHPAINVNIDTHTARSRAIVTPISMHSAKTAHIHDISRAKWFAVRARKKREKERENNDRITIRKMHKKLFKCIVACFGSCTTVFTVCSRRCPTRATDKSSKYIFYCRFRKMS